MAHPGKLAVFVLGLGLAGCGGTAAPASSSAAAGAPERAQITAIYGSTSGSMAPLWLAAEKGLFQKYGLSAEIKYAESITQPAALMANEAQIGVDDGASAIQAQVSGVPVKILATTNKSNPYAVVVRPEIKTAADLKGKTIALLRPGDTTDISARMALKPQGITVGTDVTALTVGNSAPRLAALLSGQVAGALLSEAFVEQAVSQGMHVLVSLEQAKIPYVAAAIISTESFAKANPNTLLAYLKASVEGEKFYADEQNQAESMAILAKYLKTSPSDPSVVNAYKFYHQRLAHDISPNKDGVDTIIDALKSIDQARYANVTSESVMDGSYAARLQDFQKNVWGET